MPLRNPQRATLVDQNVPWLFTPEHREWRRTVRDFCEAVVRPGAYERDINHYFDAELALRLGEMGFYGIMTPEADGGPGGDLAAQCILVEELARVDSSQAVTVHVQSASIARILELATPELRRELLPGMLTGEIFLCGALTEPSGGSDSANLTTRARLEGDHWILNGAKQFITNAGTPMTRYISVLCATGDGEDWQSEVSILLVPADAPGVQVGPPYNKMGWRGSDTHPVFFDDVRLPRNALLGVRGGGHKQTMALLTWARISIAALCTGLAQACLESTHAFVKDRQSMGKSLFEHQAVSHEVANIALMTHTARTVTYDACWKHDHGEPFGQEAAMCKLLSSELANTVAYKATQLHGGYGFIDETDVSRHYRDARILTIGEGTSEIQRLIIARTLGFPG